MRVKKNKFLTLLSFMMAQFNPFYDQIILHSLHVYKEEEDTTWTKFSGNVIIFVEVRCVTAIIADNFFLTQNSRAHSLGSEGLRIWDAEDKTLVGCMPSKNTTHSTIIKPSETYSYH